MTNQKVTEIVRFNFNPGVDTTAALDAAKSAQAFVEAQPGFLGRHLSAPMEGGGKWVDVVLWADMSSARAATEAAMGSDKCAPFFGFVDEKSIEMEHMTTLDLS